MGQKKDDNVEKWIAQLNHIYGNPNNLHRISSASKNSNPAVSVAAVVTDVILARVLAGSAIFSLDKIYSTPYTDLYTLSDFLQVKFTATKSRSHEDDY